MGFSMQEYWSALPFPPLGDLIYLQGTVIAVLLTVMKLFLCICMLKVRPCSRNIIQHQGE